METQNEKLEVLIEYLDLVDPLDSDQIEQDGNEFTFEDNTYRVLNQKEYDEAIEGAIDSKIEEVRDYIEDLDCSDFQYGYYIKIDVDKQTIEDDIKDDPENFIGESIHFDDYYIFEV